MGYAQIVDLNRYFENFATMYYGVEVGRSVGIDVSGTSEIMTDLGHSYDKINSMLESVGRVPIVPIGTMKNGKHHPHLVEWNCSDMIYTKLKSRHSYEFNGELPGWMTQFATRCKEIFGDIASERITFDFDNTKSGIGYPTEVIRVGRAQLVTNWDSGFYFGSDYQRNFRIKIDGTGASNSISDSTFKVSNDDGYSWTTLAEKTGTDWVGIQTGFSVRWAYGSTSGSQVQLNIGDEWRITCTPASINKVSSNARFKTFSRG